MNNTKCHICNGTGKVQWEDEVDNCPRCNKQSIESLLEDDSNYEDSSVDANINFWKDINQHFEL